MRTRTVEREKKQNENQNRTRDKGVSRERREITRRERKGDYLQAAVGLRVRGELQVSRERKGGSQLVSETLEKGVNFFAFF